MMLPGNGDRTVMGRLLIVWTLPVLGSYRVIGSPVLVASPAKLPCRWAAVGTEKEVVNPWRKYNCSRETKKNVRL